MSAETDRLNADFTARDIRIPTGCSTLNGELVVPPEPEGLVLVANGCRPDGNTSQRFAAQQLQRAGLGTLLVDLLTPEEEAEDTATGHVRFNIGLLKQRLASAAHWVADEDEARNLRLGLFGSSTVGAAALVAAADLGKSIGAVVSHGGRPDLAGNALLRVKAPTLLIVGGQDEAALEFNEDAYEMLDCDKTLAILPAAGPFFKEAGTMEEAARLASEWFLKHLRPFPGARFRDVAVR